MSGASQKKTAAPGTKHSCQEPANNAVIQSTHSELLLQPCQAPGREATPWSRKRRTFSRATANGCFLRSPALTGWHSAPQPACMGPGILRLVFWLILWGKHLCAIRSLIVLIEQRSLPRSTSQNAPQVRASFLVGQGRS